MMTMQMFGSAPGRIDKTTGGKTMAKEKWMQDAVKRPGALTAKAKAAGQSPMGFARSHQHSKGLTGQQARAAVNMQKSRRGMINK